MIAFLALLALGRSVVLAEPASGTAPWRQVWGDEFNGPAGRPPNPKFWTAEVGGHGWGNHELEFYTARPENAHLDGSGHLVIEVRREPWEGMAYTSARLITRTKVAHRYGRFAARIKLPTGRGIWPAFWMMGDDVEKVGWPRCGEIDVMEFLGHESGTVYGTLHGPARESTTADTDGVPDYDNGGGAGGSFTLDGGRRFPETFHEFAVEWEPDSVRWLVDGKVYQTHSPKNVAPGKWVFDHPFFILLNVAVGGDWPGPPDGTTVFPQRMLVDWVRVEDTTGAHGPPVRKAERAECDAVPGPAR